MDKLADTFAPLVAKWRLLEPDGRSYLLHHHATEANRAKSLLQDLKKRGDAPERSLKGQERLAAVHALAGELFEAIDREVMGIGPPPPEVKDAERAWLIEKALAYAIEVDHCYGEDIYGNERGRRMLDKLHHYLDELHSRGII